MQVKTDKKIRGGGGGVKSFTRRWRLEWEIKFF